MHKKSQNLEPPRTLKGRRARRIWRELAQKLAANDQLHAATRALLAVYATTIANIEAKPAEATVYDLKDAEKIGRVLGLTR